jgi:hypothetical protein
MTTIKSDSKIEMPVNFKAYDIMEAGCGVASMVIGIPPVYFQIPLKTILGVDDRGNLDEL